MDKSPQDDKTPLNRLPTVIATESSLPAPGLPVNVDSEGSNIYSDPPPEVGRSSNFLRAPARRIHIDSESSSIFSGGDLIFGPTSSVNLIHSISALSQAQPEDIQQITAAQISILTQYYNSVLAQASASFRSALVFSGIGVLFFLGAIIFILGYQLQNAALLSAIIGTIIEAISGLNFWLYGKTTSQLAHYHQSLDQIQRFLLAHNISMGLEGPTKQETIAKLVTAIAIPDRQPTGKPNP